MTGLCMLTLLTYTITSHRSFFLLFFFKRDCILFKRSWQTFFYKADFFCEAQRDGESHCESYLKKDTSKILSKSICRMPMECLMGQNNMIRRGFFFMISPLFQYENSQCITHLFMKKASSFFL